MRLVLAIAALVALPLHAAAQAPAPAPEPAPAPVEPAPPNQGEPTAPPPADAPAVDPAYGERPNRDVRDFPAPRGKDVIIVSYPDRSKKNITVLLALAGSGVAMGALGLYFHLDSRSAANEINADSSRGVPWSAAHQDTYERSERSAAIATVLYGVGGALVLASAVTYIVTEPKAETMVIQPHGTGHASLPRRTPIVAPTRGGALVGGAWSF
jgi:hypothetical protein